MGHDDYVKHALFRGDGKVLATASGDKTVRLWDVADPAAAKAIGGTLTGHVNTEYLVAFSPSDDFVATASGDHVVRLWDLDLEHAIERICDSTREVLTEAQWRRHVPQLSYDPPCD